MQIYPYFSYFLSRLSAVSPQKHAIYMYVVSVPLVWVREEKFPVYLMSYEYV